MSLPMGHVDASFRQNRVRRILRKRNAKAGEETLTGGFQSEICTIMEEVDPICWRGLRLS